MGAILSSSEGLALCKLPRRITLPHVFPSTCLPVNLEECHSPKMHFVASSTKRHRTCFMAYLDINNLSKIEMKILNAVISNVIYVLSYFSHEQNDNLHLIHSL